MTSLWIDKREQWATRPEFWGPSPATATYTAEYRTLDIGDFWIVCGTENTQPCLILERKTVADLAASVKDKRFREQKLRCRTAQQTYSACRIIYLIEGKPPLRTGNRRIDGILERALAKALDNLTLRDGITVVFSANMEETYLWISNLCTRLAQDPSFLGGAGAGAVATGATDATAEYASTVRLEKQKNMTPDVFFRCTLRQIPGINQAMIDIITARYANLANMLADMLADTTQNMWTEIEITQTTGRKCRIGKKANDALFRYLCGIMPEAPPPARKRKQKPKLI